LHQTELKTAFFGIIFTAVTVVKVITESVAIMVVAAVIRAIIVVVTVAVGIFVIGDMVAVVITKTIFIVVVAAVIITVFIKITIAVIIDMVAVVVAKAVAIVIVTTSNQVVIAFITLVVTTAVIVLMAIAMLMAPAVRVIAFALRVAGVFFAPVRNGVGLHKEVCRAAGHQNAIFASACPGRLQSKAPLCIFHAGFSSESRAQGTTLVARVFDHGIYRV
jgi:hypothetical protein